MNIPRVLVIYAALSAVLMVTALEAATSQQSSSSSKYFQGYIYNTPSSVSPYGPSDYQPYQQGYQQQQGYQEQQGYQQQSYQQRAYQQQAYEQRRASTASYYDPSGYYSGSYYGQPVKSSANDQDFYYWQAHSPNGERPRPTTGK